MLRTNNYTTLLLVIIVLILIVGVGIALYYVLELDWFGKDKTVQIYKDTQTEIQKVEVQIKKEVKYDITKRTYNLALNTEELKVIVYKDGTVGITMVENERYAKIQAYNELLNKETKLSLTNVIRAYHVMASNDETVNNYIVLLDSQGNLYELVEQELINNGKYAFIKIEGLAKIIDVRQITNDGLTENITGINAIAIDEESNELLLTDYLIKNEK